LNRFSDKENEGLKYIGLAEEITPNFARLYYEKAKFMLNFSHNDEAKKALIQAMNIRMEILSDIAKDPFFLEYKSVINEVKVEMKEHLKKSCYAIASQTNTMKKIFDEKENTIALDRLSIYALWKYARSSFMSQYKLLSENIANVNTDDVDILKSHIESIEEMMNDTYVADTYHDVPIEEETLKTYTRYKTKVAAIDSSSKAMALFFIISLGFLIMVGTKLLNEVPLWVPIVTTVTFAGLWIRLKMNKTKVRENSILNLEAVKEEKKQEIASLQRLYTKIEKAFTLFEQTTVSKSSSKLVPLKSLNNASYGSVVRVTPYAYKKYVEQGNSLKIVEDFSKCLNIESTEAETYSFLAKVIDKKYNSMVLSRFKAY